MYRVISGDLWTHFIFLQDYLLLPFYLFIVFYISNRFCDKYYPVGHPWRFYFKRGFLVKILGALFISLAYQYYYNGGDTSAFFYHSNIINSALNESLFKWVSLVLHIPSNFDGKYYDYISQMMWYESPSSYFISSLTAVVGIFTFNTFLPTAIIFGALSFTGTWALFRTFAIQYRGQVRYIAAAILFIPSLVTWGSGIFKDTVCLFSLGWLTYSVFQVIIERNFKLKNILMLIVCFYILFTVKVYILLAFVPALAIWILFTYSQKINPPFLRVVLNVLLLVGAAGGFFVVSNSFSDQLGMYSLENITQTSTITRDYITSVSKGDEGSSYDIGIVDPTPIGMLLKLPASVNAALFRPYLWEARKPMVLLNAIETFFFLFYTLKVIFSVGIGKIIGTIKREPNIQFFLIFTLIFAFSVGLTSANFGALSRYRIPCLPFYTLALVLIYYKNKPDTNNFFKLTLAD